MASSVVGAQLAGAPSTCPSAGRSMAACSIPSHPAASAASAAPPSLSSDDGDRYGSARGLRPARTARVYSDSISPLVQAGPASQCLDPVAAVFQ
eukprot:964858-Rhodomonas_salina.2